MKPPPRPAKVRPMTADVLKYSLADGVATLTLNRPEVMNALSSALRQALLAAINRAGAEARVIVLTGAGRAFCSGQDLGDVDLATLDLQKVLTEEYEPLLTAIAGCPVPVIAAVNGAAAGAGAGLALACDVVIAAESASFIQAFTRIGLVPDAGGSYWLPRQVGMARAMGAMLFAEKVSARQAADWGMIWEAVPDADFAAHWQAQARTLAQGPTLAYRGVKQALRASFDNDFATQLALEARLQGTCGKSQDFREGVAAFLEKRPANFIGS
jgi:2-(1,2-epoxy-1,2-dihydrophenyl)acetyl-CoA isomerase